jgi:hypothetical protein
MVYGIFKIRNKLSQVHNNDQIVLIFLFNICVYIFVPNEFMIGQAVLQLLTKRRAVAMVNKQVGVVILTSYCVIGTEY